MAASMNFSLAAAVLLSGLLILGAVQATEAVVACPPSIMCAQGSYVTCANMPGQYFNGCDCWCGSPPGCTGCTVQPGPVSVPVYTP